jgi:hypothetical protein
MFPDGRTHNQIIHILIGRRWQSNVLDILSFGGADCDIDHYLVVATFKESLTVSKQISHRFLVRRKSQETEQGRG